MQLFEGKLIVVTGAAGLIGSGVVRHLNDIECEQILLVDRLDETDKWRHLVGKRFVDLIDKQSLFEWLDGREDEIGAFVHLGACSDTMETDSAYLLENNYHYTRRLAEYALKHEKRFIYASSAATYGDGAQGFGDSHEAIDTLRPLNMYGYSKQLFDQWALRQGVLDKVVGLKYFNVFGPNEDHKGRMASAVSRMVPQVEREGQVRLFRSNEPARYKDGEQLRDFLYVKDAARMTCTFLQCDYGGIYNIGSGAPASWNRLAQAVFCALGRPERIEYVDMPAELSARYQNYTCADMAKYLNLGLSGATWPLEDAVGDYVRNHLLRGATW